MFFAKIDAFPEYIEKLEVRPNTTRNKMRNILKLQGTPPHNQHYDKAHAESFFHLKVLL